jgi:membrane-bound ClpP family serine protease
MRLAFFGAGILLFFIGGSLLIAEVIMRSQGLILSNDVTFGTSGIIMGILGTPFFCYGLYEKESGE